MEEFTTDWMYRLGDEVKDLVSGFQGKIVARVEYLNGCRQHCVEPKVDKDGKMQKGEYIDEGQLEIVGLPVNEEETTAVKPPGGVMRNEPER